MDSRFIPIETVPSKTPFGLDQLRRSYKTALDAASAIAAAPNVGDPDDSFPFMFLMPITTPESSESATRVDLIYQGCLRESSGNPVLPAVKHTLERAVASATTYTSAAIFPAVATSPATLQYKQPTSVIVLISTSAAPADVCPDPDAVGSGDIITWSITTTQPASSFPGIVTWLLTNAFVQRIVETVNAEEIVPGQYWVVTKRKTQNLFPYAPP